ncbi:two-component sensor histidine kinase [Saccharibacillus sp. O23]|uniref:sensor histidine kinase n=1 Tax=Saccharibacillus sp. O23 TaxID=2009338 RepID=UPI000B4E73E9|nr:HAMP domain-containing sensor histidine kinase [Saccharibacillus sp. O23]OWR28328.1 two-component sensor histidine kinase [Saccharibacillus sp. O23]
MTKRSGGKRRRTGITARLFLVTAAIFMLFYAIVLAGQILVFPQFYEHRKMTKLERGAEELAAWYEEDPARFEQGDSSFLTRLRRDDVNAALTDFDGNNMANDPFRIQVVRSDGQVLDVSLFYLVVAYRSELERLKLSAGESVRLYGEFGEGGDAKTFYAFYLGAADAAEGGREAGERGAQNEAQAITGTLLTKQLPDTSKLSRRMGLLYLVLDEFFPLSDSYRETLEQMKPVELKWIDSFSGNRSGIRIQPVRGADGEIKLLILVTSLQEIKETNSALRVFYAYLGAGGLILIVLLSIFYSRIVTRPLLRLNERAENMKNLDFAGEQPPHRSDELGNLSNTLFELSSKLGATLEELSDTNARLTREIEEKKQLEQLQKDFFANASHELKTPISIVRGFAEGMRDGIGAGRQDHYIGVILEESEKMERLVQDMLELLRLDSPAVKLYKSPVLLSELTEQALQKLVYRMREKGLAARIVRQNERTVIVDVGKIEQVVLNLLTNAIRHAEPGSTIEIDVCEEGGRCVYSVHNAGAGIPEAYLSRIWERFFRAEAARDRESGGTGLGLAIVKRILELHDCEYEARNEQGGVTFEVAFPD